MKFCRMRALLVAILALAWGPGARHFAGPPNASPAAFRDSVVLMSFHRNISPAGQQLVPQTQATELKRIGVDVHVLKVPSGRVMDVIQKLKGRSEVRYAIDEIDALGANDILMTTAAGNTGENK